MPGKHRIWSVLTKSFLRERGQVVYAVILVVIIPTIILVNTLFTISQYNNNLELQLLRHANTIYDLFDAGVDIDVNSPDVIQEKVMRIAQSGPEELRLIDILIPDQDGFRVIASSLPNSIGTVSARDNAALSWQRNQAISHVVRPSEQEIRNVPELGGSRYINIISPLHDRNNAKVALLNVRMSLRAIDESNQAGYLNSLILLTLTVITVILLLLANSRLFEYTLLFQKLKEVDQMKDEFISMASHELRSPITAIKGYVSMLSEGSLGTINEQGKKGIAVIDLSVRKLADLVEDLLNVSRIEQNRLQITLKPTNIVEAIQTTIEEVEINAQIKNIELSFASSGAWPPVFADPEKLRQVLINLLNNAIKYTKQGSVSVSLKNEPQHVVVRIKDTGIGIAPKDREKLFTKFYRVENEETKGIIGTGLGLWITKRLVTLMGGNIHVDSIEGTGTEVTFSVPKAQPDEREKIVSQKAEAS